MSTQTDNQGGAGGAGVTTASAPSAGGAAPVETRQTNGGAGANQQPDSGTNTQGPDDKEHEPTKSGAGAKADSTSSPPKIIQSRPAQGQGSGSRPNYGGGASGASAPRQGGQGQGAQGGGGQASWGQQNQFYQTAASYGSYAGRPPRNVGGGSGSLGSEFLSTTNLYIRGLTPNTTDLDLVNLCNKYGKITSTKAIIDPATGKCKGYGFVDFEVSQSADMAVKGLVSQGVQAQMAKQQEQDPTNLYLANLPEYVDDGYLEHMFLTFGNVVSTRVLRNKDGSSKGVGFCRMESRDQCVKIIDQYNKKQLPGSKEFLLVKFADGGNKKKSQYKNQNAGMPISFDHQNGMGMPMNHGGLMSPRYMPGQQGAYGMHNNWNMYAAGNMPIQGMVPTSVHPGSADPNGMLPSLMAQVNQLHLNSGMSGGYPQQYAANLQMPFGAQSGMMQVQGGYDSSNSPPQLGQMEEAQQHYQAYGGAQGK